ncbi:MAG: pyridoxal-phosphate dependent enzyme, partial [Gemmatimonadales bacterium]|nr:pyridoxal-phosphate dependent enzyme [Gemmatimonadales bacterium]
MALEGTARTPLLEIDGVWVKLECAHPDGSVRDRAAAFLLRQAAARGELRRGDVVVESVAGAAGVALARATAAAGCRLMLFLPADAGGLQRRLLERLGAEVRLTPATDGPAGAEAARDAYRGRRGYHVADLRRHPDNVRLMHETTGAELAGQLAGRGVV